MTIMYWFIQPGLDLVIDIISLLLVDVDLQLKFHYKYWLMAILITSFGDGFP